MKQLQRVAWILVPIFALPLRAEGVQKTAKATYYVPYRLTDTQHLLVRAKINGKGPFNFILDTGAPALFVVKSVGQQLGIEPDKSGWAAFESFEIEGGVKVPNARGRIETPFQIEGLNGLGLAGAELHGMIGYNLLARYRVEFDFTKDKMVWTELDFEPPPPPGIRAQGGSAGGLDALGGLMKFLGGLIGKKADPEVAFRGFLGVEVADDAQGVRVKSVSPGGPADKAGVRAEDRVKRFQGKEVHTSADLQRLAAGLTPGQTATFGLLRSGEGKTVSVKMGEGL